MRQKTKWVLGVTGLAFVFCLSGSRAKAQVDDEGSTMDEPLTAPECRNAGKPISFDTGSAKLDKKAQSALDDVATWLEVEDERTVHLEGNADKRGDKDANLELSERRADAAREYLLGQGVEPEQIETVAHGENGEGDDAAIETPGSADRTVAVTICDASVEMSEMAGEPAPSMVTEPEAAAEPEAVAPIPQPETPAESQTQVYEPVTVVPPPVLEPAPAPKGYVPPSRIGVEATVGAGATGFANSAARSFAETGASWDARLIFGSRSPIAFEAAYIGSAQNVDALGLQNDALLLGNGAEGAVRFNFTRARVQPYIFGGGGWTRYEVINTPVAQSSVQRTDDVVMVPVGAGISARLAGPFLLDIRGMYRTTFDETMFNAASGQNVSLDSWNGHGRLGFEF